MQSAQTKVERGQFELQMPAQFMVTPSHEIELPYKRKALVFDTPVDSYALDPVSGERKCVTKAGWRVIVVTRTGKMGSRYDRDQYGQTFSDPLLLGLYVRKIVAELLRVKRTTTTVAEPEDDE